MSSQAEQLQQAMAFFRVEGQVAVLKKPAVRQAVARPARHGAALRLADSFAAQAGPDEANFTHF
jgi:methyl-accepting chemotaxis protein